MCQRIGIFDYLHQVVVEWLGLPCLGASLHPRLLPDRDVRVCSVGGGGFALVDVKAVVVPGEELVGLTRGYPLELK